MATEHRIAPSAVLCARAHSASDRAPSRGGDTKFKANLA